MVAPWRSCFKLPDDHHALLAEVKSVVLTRSSRPPGLTRATRAPCPQVGGSCRLEKEVSCVDAIARKNIKFLSLRRMVQTALEL